MSLNTKKVAEQKAWVKPCLRKLSQAELLSLMERKGDMKTDEIMLLFFICNGAVISGK